MDEIKKEMDNLRQVIDSLTKALFASLIIRFLLAETVFSSRNKSSGTVFQFVFSAKRTRPKAPSKIHQELDQLKVKWEQPQKRLEEVDAMIQLKESNLAQLPQAINEKKKEREKFMDRPLTWRGVPSMSLDLLPKCYF